MTVRHRRRSLYYRAAHSCRRHRPGNALLLPVITIDPDISPRRFYFDHEKAISAQHNQVELAFATVPVELPGCRTQRSAGQ